MSNTPYKFAEFARLVFPNVEPGSPQYMDLQHTFMAGMVEMHRTYMSKPKEFAKLLGQNTEDYLKAKFNN